MLKIAVCDDDKTMLNFIGKKVEALFIEIGIEHSIKLFLSGSEFLKAHKTDPFDVVFLDIVMPKINGFDIAKQMRGLFQRSYIIFVTTESSLVYESFDFQPFYFIPKVPPEILSERLSHVVKRLGIHLSVNKKIILKGTYGDEYSIEPMDIISAESSTKYVIYNFATKPPLRSRQKLIEAQAILNPCLFARIHNRYIVNMRFIKRIDYPNLTVTMNNERVFNISRAYKKELKNLYDRYLNDFE